MDLQCSHHVRLMLSYGEAIYWGFAERYVAVAAAEAAVVLAASAAAVAVAGISSYS